MNDIDRVFERSKKTAPAGEEKTDWEQTLANLSPEARNLPCFAWLRDKALLKIKKLLSTKGRSAEEAYSFWSKALEVAKLAGIDQSAVEELAAEHELNAAVEGRPAPYVVGTTYSSGRARRVRARDVDYGDSEGEQAEELAEELEKE